MPSLVVRPFALTPAGQVALQPDTTYCFPDAQQYVGRLQAVHAGGAILHGYLNSHSKKEIERLSYAIRMLQRSDAAIRRTQLTLVLTVACAIGLLGVTYPRGTASQSSVAWRTVTVGVEHVRFERDADESGTAVGPWSINLLRIDLSRVRLDVFHALDEAVGLETVSSIAQRRGAIAAINGGYFRTTGTFRGDSTGTLQIDGALLSEPDRARSAVGLVRQGGATRLVFGHVVWHGVIDVAGDRRPLDGLNRPRGANEVVLFTPGFHQTTLTDSTGTEVVVRAGRVDRIREDAGSTPIPPDGFVLSATGAAREWARTALRPGTRVRVSAGLEPADPTPTNPWTAAEDIVGAGPKLVTAGRVDITIAREKMQPAFSTDRHPRTAIASLAHGKALLLVVDGRQPALSVGMSLEELARLLIELGAVEAMNLDGGGSSAMVVEGKVVNHPSDPTGERPVSDAILVLPRTR
jgi:exopolysaccharide biosynthesis protein